MTNGEPRLAPDQAQTIFDHAHVVQVGPDVETFDEAPTETGRLRRRIEPWLSAVFQAENLSLLIGNGFTTAMAHEANAPSVSMDLVRFGCGEDALVATHAEKLAKGMGRSKPNAEDQFAVAFSLLQGLEILADERAGLWRRAIDREFLALLKSVLATEQGIKQGLSHARVAGGPTAHDFLVSFLMSFASRAASRERLHVFTSDYDRLIEFGCDLAGLRVLDRFAGALAPEFRSSRQQIDLHYTAPGTRAEPRHLEGVIHLTKFHGSLDWRFEPGGLRRVPLGFGAGETHPDIPETPKDSVVIYPNAAKDVETAAWPYADLFRDFSAALCRPNSVLVTYGYGYGDSHVNRIIADMLTVPSTHLVIIAWGPPPHERVKAFLDKAGHRHQVTLLLGTHFADLRNLVTHYLPKPAIDPLTLRMVELIERRGWRHDHAADVAQQDPEPDV
jgi:hypothetical protein